MPTFDGENLLITLDAATPEVDAKVDLYSDWKEWFKISGNAKYPIAFDTTGGDPTTATGKVAAYFFLRNDNGWRIQPAEEDADITIIGNLYPRDSTLSMFMETTGGFTVLITIERDASSVVETVGSGLDAAQSAQLEEAHKLLRNKRVLNIIDGIETIYDDDNVTPLFTRSVWVDAAGTVQYDGTLVPHRVDRYT